ncbi:MAG: peptidase, partial [Bacteroidota bacterium]
MRNTLLLCLFCFTLSLNAQSDEDLIRHSIHNYFNGTAYSYVDQIESAFHPEAQLFLESKTGELIIFTAA